MVAKIATSTTDDHPLRTIDGSRYHVLARCAILHQSVDGEKVTFVLFDRTGRRAEIIRAAFAQLATVGFEGLRMRQIAAEVGIDQSTLHHHFPTKQDIVAAVTEHPPRPTW